jgi:copper chaperone CopZ
MVQGLGERVVFRSSGIKGAKDVDRLEDGLSGIDGVREVHVDIDAHMVEVFIDPTVVNRPALRSEVEELGYKIEAGSTSEELEQTQPGL